MIRILSLQRCLLICKSRTHIKIILNDLRNNGIVTILRYKPDELDTKKLSNYNRVDLT